MAFDLTDDWVWDFWTIADGPDTHLFFLHAPRSLGDPDRRHVNARIGHAVSTDLRTWTRLPEALAPSPEPGFDDLACWTGSAVADPRGGWRLFTSGLHHGDGGREQRIGVSRSTDLTEWVREPWTLTVDPRWYDDGTGAVGDIHWRDPFVVQDASGLWHMYITAKAAGSGSGRGVAAHARSADLLTWEVGPPLSVVSGRFDQLEVIRVVEVEGRWVLLFSCLSPEMPGAEPDAGGIWCANIAGPGEPFDPASAYRLTGEEWYVGAVVPDPAGGWSLLAFRNRDENGYFVGGVSDPMPVHWVNNRLTIAF